MLQVYYSTELTLNHQITLWHDKNVHDRTTDHQPSWSLYSPLSIKPLQDKPTSQFPFVRKHWSACTRNRTVQVHAQYGHFPLMHFKGMRTPVLYYFLLWEWLFASLHCYCYASLQQCSLSHFDSSLAKCMSMLISVKIPTF